MAKRRRKASTAIVMRPTFAAPRAAAPIIRVSAPRAAPAKRRHHRRRSNGTGGALSFQRAGGLALGGAIFGYLQKQDFYNKLPTLPVIGRTGTAAIGLVYLSKRAGSHSMIRDTAIAACVLSGYQLGHDGKISGDEMAGDETSGYIDD